MKDAIDIMFMLNIIAFNMREAYLFYHMTNFRVLKKMKEKIQELKDWSKNYIRNFIILQIS